MRRALGARRCRRWGRRAAPAWRTAPPPLDKRAPNVDARGQLGAAIHRRPHPSTNPSTRVVDGGSRDRGFSRARPVVIRRLSTGLSTAGRAGPPATRDVCTGCAGVVRLAIHSDVHKLAPQGRQPAMCGAQAYRARTPTALAWALTSAGRRRGMPVTTSPDTSTTSSGSMGARKRIVL